MPAAAVALLATLLLRGPQTAAELRATTARLHRFADISSVEGFLDELATKEPARVLKLALDVHLQEHVVAMQHDGSAPKPPQRFKPKENRCLAVCC